MEQALELITVEKPIKHQYYNFPEVKRYTTLADGTKHGRYVKEGRTKYFDELVLYEERFYDHGKLHGKHSLWMLHQGQVYDYLQINNYEYGELHGEQVYYEEHSWTVRRKEYYDHGKLMRAKLKEKYTKGYVANYNAEGLKHGRCRTYYKTHHTDTSTIKTDGYYKNGRRVGVHREYAQGTKRNEPGAILSEKEYQPGEDLEVDRSGYTDNQYRHDGRYKLNNKNTH